MAYHLQIIIATYFLAATSLCNAMEIVTKEITKTIPQANILKEITCIDRPYNVVYLTHDRAIGRSDSDGKCFLINPTTDTKIKKTPHTSHYPAYAIHPHNKRFALYGDRNITIYNDSGEKTHTKATETLIESVAFDASNDTVYFNNSTKIIKWDYIKNVSCSLSYGHNMNINKILCHPTESLIYLVNPSGDIALINTNPLSETKHYKQVVRDNTIYMENTFIIQSHNGPIVAYSQLGQLFIINLDTGKRAPSPFPKDQRIRAITSHPSNTTLITFSESKTDDILSYWDITTQELLYESTVPKIAGLSSWDNLSASPNKGELLITRKGKCYTVEIPKIIAAKKVSFLLLALNNQNANFADLPTDIIQLLKQYIFNLFP